jgi:TfoX/Sxy family transcriptional regulator of competence genes
MNTVQAELEARLAAMLAAHNPITKRMFGGLCFMVRGHMLVGTFRDGMMARVSKDDHSAALQVPGASAMEMNGRIMEGFILISADSVKADAAMRRWIDKALVYNATLPAKAVKPAKAKTAKKAK